MVNQMEILKLKEKPQRLSNGFKVTEERTREELIQITPSKGWEEERWKRNGSSLAIHGVNAEGQTDLWWESWVELDKRKWVGNF